MTNVAVSGAGGKLAGAIIEAVVAADDLDLVALYNPNRAGQVVEGIEISDKVDLSPVDVMVEAAPAGDVIDNLRMWGAADVATVVGTSGFTPERLDQLRSEWGIGAPCLVVPNFSIGAVLMMRFAEEAASSFEVVEIIERHHATKRDAPSGTSLASAMGVSRGGGVSAEGSDELVPGARGARVEGVRVHSLRLPGVIAQQEVALSNPGEILSIEHLSTSYASFGSGALAAIRGVGSLAGGVHLGLETILQ